MLMIDWENLSFFSAHIYTSVKQEVTDGCLSVPEHSSERSKVIYNQKHVSVAFLGCFYFLWEYDCFRSRLELSHFQSEINKQQWHLFSFFFFFCSATRHHSSSKLPARHLVKTFGSVVWSTTPSSGTKTLCTLTSLSTNQGPRQISLVLKTQKLWNNSSKRRPLPLRVCFTSSILVNCSSLGSVVVQPRIPGVPLQQDEWNHLWGNNRAFFCEGYQ